MYESDMQKTGRKMTEQPEEKEIGIDLFCFHCCFWEQGHSLESGYCRKTIPSVFPVTEDMEFWVETAWPKTSREDWCGELELREEEKRNIKAIL